MRGQTLDPTSDAAFALLEALFAEVASLFPDEYMHWYVAVDDARELRTDCVQYYDNTPGDGGNSTVSHGMRDYSRDFDAAAGADWALYAPPDGVTCTDVTGSAAEPRPVSWTSSRWGGF